MHQGLLRAIHQRMSARPDDELLRLWVENDRFQYSPETFEAVRSIFAERGITPPPQDEPPAMAGRATRRDGPIVFGDPGAEFWFGLLRAVLWIGMGLASVQLLGYLLKLWWLREGLVSRPGARWPVDPWELLSAPMVRDLATNIVLSVWLLVAARMGLRLRPRARVVLVVYAWAALLALAVSAAGNFYTYRSDTRSMEDALFPIALMAERAQLALYPVILLLLMRRPQVRELFTPAVPGFEVHQQVHQPLKEEGPSLQPEGQAK
jgi:hypothetical protein